MTKEVDFQHRHYVWLAERLHDEGASQETIQRWADALAGTNATFSPARFIAAAKGEPLTKTMVDLGSTFSHLAD